MKFLQDILFRLLCAAALFIGAVFMMAGREAVRPFYAKAAAVLGTPETSTHFILLVGAGALLFVAGVYGLLPAAVLEFRRRTLSFPGAHGTVVIQLGSMETALCRDVGKLPEVKTITVRVLPTKEGNVRVVGYAVLHMTKASGVKLISSRVIERMRAAATDHLGPEMVASVDLVVRKIIVEEAGRAAVPVAADLPAPMANVQRTPEPRLVPEPVEDVPFHEPKLSSAWDEGAARVADGTAFSELTDETEPLESGKVDPDKPV